MRIRLVSAQILTLCALHHLDFQIVLFWMLVIALHLHILFEL